jgi:hypothetical protein
MRLCSPGPRALDGTWSWLPIKKANDKKHIIYVLFAHFLSLGGRKIPGSG